MKYGAPVLGSILVSCILFFGCAEEPRDVEAGGEESEPAGDEIATELLRGTVTANEVSIAFESVGPANGEVILLIAGQGAQLTMWPDELVDELVDHGYRVIRFDNRDTGLSARLDHLGQPDWEAIFTALNEGRQPDPPYRLEDMAADAVGLLDALGVRQAHMVGASLGGILAQIVAAEYPERTLSLTSIASTSGNPALPGMTEDVMALPPPLPPGSDPDAIVAREILAWKTIGSPGYPTPDSVLEARVRRDLERSYDPAAAERQTAALVAASDRRDRLATIRVPTVVLHGEADPLVPLENGEDTAASIPGAELRVIPGMGHDLPLPLIPRVAEAIMDAATGSAAADSAGSRQPV